MSRARLLRYTSSRKCKSLLCAAISFRAVGSEEIGSQAGLTLIELIVTVAILAILASAAVPLARFRAQREKEQELRYDLWQMRDAIDKYKDAADKSLSDKDR